MVGLGNKSSYQGCFSPVDNPFFFSILLLRCDAILTSIHVMIKRARTASKIP
jgi:hypothetical protein